MDEIELITHMARVRLVKNSDEWAGLVDRSKQRFDLDADDKDIFTFRAEISNDLLDSHFTHMAASTLNNYAVDAEKGVAFLKGHDHRSLPIGYSVEGKLEQDGPKQRVIAGFYTVRGLADTDDLIFRMQKGLVRDVSVGFNGGRMVCDLCGADFWECRHYPGLKFEEKKGDTVSTKLSTFTIEDARLSEVSGVFDGSTPDAGLIKAQRAAKAGELTQEQVHLLEQRYRIHLPVTTVRAGSGLEFTKEKKMEDKDLERIRHALVIAKVVSEVDAKAADEGQLVEHVEKLSQRLTALEPQAADGRQYRTDLVNEALSEGVRALGNEFDKTAYESLLTSAPLATVKRMRDDWKKAAGAALPPGRATSESNGQKPAKKTSRVPDTAYQI